MGSALSAESSVSRSHPPSQQKRHGAKVILDSIPTGWYVNHRRFVYGKSEITTRPSTRSLWTRRVLSNLTARWPRPALQPRFAIGLAMTILSFAMVERGAGVPRRHTQPADLNSMRIWHAAEDRVIRVKDRAVMYYENIRFVYQLECQLKDLQQQQEDSERQRASTPRPGSEWRDNWPEELASRKHISQLPLCSERGQ